MIVFSQERKNAIKAMKAFIKGHTQSVGYRHYVLYAALRGQDIRKTSHLPDGSNAIKALNHVKGLLKRHHEKPNNFFFGYIIDKSNQMIFKPEDAKWLQKVLDEALEITTLTPEANEGITLMESRQHR